jgi:hypothetical protein
MTTIDPTTHLTRFSVEERRILERFVARVAELRASRFLVASADPLTLKIDFVGGIATNLRLDGPGRPEVQEVIGAFRELYGHRESTSAVMVSSLIGRHAHARGTPQGAQLASKLKQYRARLAQRASGDSRMSVFSEEAGPAGNFSTITPKEAIELIINGDLLHYETAKAAQLEGDPQLTAMMWMMLHSTIRDFADQWQELALFVREILDCPDLDGSQAL